MSAQKLIGSRWIPTGITLGSGGQAQVLVVTDKSGKLPGEWAAKVLTNIDRAPRIEKEIATAKAVFAVGAPVIEIVDDYLQTEPEAKKPWFVMQIAKGGNLSKHIKAGQVYGGSIQESLVFFRDITSAVCLLHHEKVAHRDLKPDNILLDGNRPILADLGLCLALDDLEGDRLTGALERIGSLHYMPKEAFGRRPLDQDQYAFDAYALGKILYLLVSGRQLPGFVSPVDPDYDLSKIENSPAIRSINRTLRGLLHDNAAVRLATLGQLGEQINDLLETINTPQQNPTGIETILLQAADAISVHMDVQLNNTETQSVKTELDSIRDEIFTAWSESEWMSQLDRLIIQPNSSSIDLHREPSSTRLRSQLFGANIRTKYSLEPIEDLGYPIFTANESGCAIGIQTKKEGVSLPSVWLGSLISVKGENAIIATAVTFRPPDINAACDIIAGTQKVLTIGFHEAGLIAKVRAMAEESIKSFATALANSITR